MIRSLSLLCVLFLNTFLSSAQYGFRKDTSIPVSNGVGSLQLPWAGGLNYTQFSSIDLNQDGLNDLFVMDRHNNRITTYLNNGTTGTNSWVYAPQYEGLFPEVNGWAILYDYNCDGKPDLLTTTFRNNGIMLYRNNSQAGNLSFSIIDTTIDAQSQFGQFNIFASGFLVPEFNDIDSDGDMDIITQQFTCVGGYAFYRNRSMEDYGVCDSLDKYELVTNAWGKFAIRSGAFAQVAVGQFNINCQSESPIDQGYELARRDDTFANIFTIDIDNDGDKDAIVGDSQTDNSLLVINGGTAGNALMVSQDTLFPSYDNPVKLKSFTTHQYVDADNDGVKDLLISQSEYRNYNGIMFYKNTGSTALPQFDYIRSDFLQDQMIDVGEGAAPVFFDADADGLLDMIIGNRKITLNDSTEETGLTLYRNTGSLTQPEFTFVTDDYMTFRQYPYIGTLNPAFGDLDGDGDQDMILGLDDGRMVYWENCSSPGQPAVFCTALPYYMSIDVGNAASPHLIDLKRDGKLDLVVGNKNGVLKYYENFGSTTIPFFSTAPTVDTLGDIVLQSVNATDGFADPYFFEYNGSFRAAVACMKGDVYLYGNIDNNVGGTWTPLDTIVANTLGNRYGYNLTVAGGDINGDTMTDLVIGLFTGGVQIYLQEDSATGIAAVDEIQFQLFPNPANDQFVIRSERSGIYRVTDITGKTVLTGNINGGYAIVSVQQLSAGMYFVNIDRSRSVKLIISR